MPPENKLGTVTIQQHPIFVHLGLFEYDSMLQSPKWTNLEHCWTVTATSLGEFVAPAE